MKNYNVKNQSGIILIAHPNGYMRKALIMVLKKYCKNVLEERGWQGLPIREISSIDEIIAFEEKDNIEILITHLLRVSPDSRDIAHIRQLRMDGMRAPLIAMSFSEKNKHRIFSVERAHDLLIYPFCVNKFKETLLHCKPLNPGDKGYIIKRLCDEDFWKTLYGTILHDVEKEDWKRVETTLDKLEQCFGKNNHLRKLLSEKGIRTSWENILQYQNISKKL